MSALRKMSLLACFAVAVCADDSGLRFDDIFAHLRTEAAALSPDGEHVAYTLREGSSLYVVTVAVDHPEQALVKVRVGDDSEAVGWNDKEYFKGTGTARISWMQWLSPTRLAVETNRISLEMRGRPMGAIYVFDSDGNNARELISAKGPDGGFNVTGINPANPTEILAKSDDETISRDIAVGKSRMRRERGLIAINIENGKCRALEQEEVDALPGLIKEREQKTRPFEMQVVEGLKKLLPDHKLTVFESLGTSSRALVRAQSAADTGGFLIYEPAANRLWDFVRRVDLLLPERQFKTEAFEFKNADGHLFSGLITLPLNPRILKAPLVLFMPAKLGARASRDYRPEVKAFASMGFAVALVDGFHASNAVPLAEKISEAIEFNHQVQALDVLAEHYALSRKAVALFGEDLAGRRAIEMVAGRPGRFRCLVALAPTGVQEPSKILRGSKQQVVESSLILAWPGAAPTQQTPPSMAMARLATETLKRAGTEAELVKLGHAFQGGQPAARAEVFRTIEDFLTEHLYRYSVMIGETVPLEVVPPDRSSIQR